MSEHVIYKNKNNELVKQNRRKTIGNIAKKTLIALAVILFLNQVIAFVTGYNFIWSGIKYLFGIGSDITAVDSVSFESDDWASKTPGSWKITSSAELTGLTTAKADFYVETTLKRDSTNKKDVILVLDTSKTMQGEGIDEAKEGVSALVESLLSDQNNRVALITYNDNANIVSEFVNYNDKDTILNYIKGITTTGSRNYNDALNKIGDVLNNDNYESKTDTDLVAVFLTSGNPSGTGYTSTYMKLKDTYRYLTVNSISYRTNTINVALKDISDKQFLARTGDLENVLLEAAFGAEAYQKFQIVDYVEDEYFEVKSKSDITVSNGTVELVSGNKIIWTLSPDFITGSSATMSINLTIKEEYSENLVVDLYPINSSLEVTSQLLNDQEKTKDSNLTPVLQRLYWVEYSYNWPTSCREEGNTVRRDAISDKQPAFKNINMNLVQPKACSGYIFKGWEIVTDGVNQTGKTSFQVPQYDVKIKGTWAKLAIAKSMKGTVYSRADSLYDIVKAGAAEKNYIYVSPIRDDYSDSLVARAPVYYLDNSNNNVLYAGFCWQIVRTTTTGGVKIIYNGKPDSNGTCTTDTSTAVALSFGSPMGGRDVNFYATGFDSEYWYGDSFDYNESTKQFTIKGNEFRGNYYTDNNREKYLSKYTCKSETQDGTCSNLYFMIVSEEKIYSSGYSKADTIVANVYTAGNVNYDSIAHLNRWGFGGAVGSLSSVGYMFNNSYVSYTAGEASNLADLFYPAMYWYEDTHKYSWNPPGTFIPGSSVYTNNNHYTCDDNECSKIRYYYDENNYIVLSDGDMVEDALFKMLGSSGPSLTENTELNKYDSAAKSLIDWWFEENLQNKSNTTGTSYANYLEDVIFCNDRTITDLGGWNPNGGAGNLLFNSNSSTSRLTCTNKTDQFSVSNPYARLKYPVGLLTKPEYEIMNSAFTHTGLGWWLGSPLKDTTMAVAEIDDSCINDPGKIGCNVGIRNTLAGEGLRPVVSLNSNVLYISGTGAADDPYVIDY